jgi:hypothetical protein
MRKQEYRYDKQRWGYRWTNGRCFLTSFSSILQPALLGTTGLPFAHLQAFNFLLSQYLYPMLPTSLALLPQANSVGTLCLPARIHSVTSQKAVIFIFTIV